MDNRSASEGYLSPGTRVRYDGLGDDRPEYGVVVHCWMDQEIRAFDCYVAFFGSAEPIGKPDEKPYILRYAAMSLTVIEP